MINKEKVIKGLEACTAWDGLHQCQPKFYGYDCPYDDEADCKLALMKDALALLKEKEPQPVIFDRQCEEEPDHWVRKGFCPKCHQVVLWMVNREYCGFCGQKVKWNE